MQKFLLVKINHILLKPFPAFSCMERQLGSGVDISLELFIMFEVSRMKKHLPLLLCLYYHVLINRDHFLYIER